MAMSEQNAVDRLEADAGLQDLPLGAFAAIDQKTMFVMLYHLG